MGRAFLFGRGIPVFPERSWIQRCMRAPLTAAVSGVFAVVFLLFLFVGTDFNRKVDALEQAGGVKAQDAGASAGSETATVRSGTDESEARTPRVKILPRSSIQPPGDAAPLSEAWERLSEQIERLVRVGLAVEKWCGAQGALPETLEELVEAGGYLNEMPEDLYAAGRRVSYRVAAENRFGIIYSFGPDGDDDGGVSIAVYRLDVSVPPPDGDIVIHVRPPPADEFIGQEVFEILLFMKEQDGRDNAMIHYVEAGKLWPGHSETPDHDQIRWVLELGWHEGMTELHDYLAKWQSMFKRIRQGARVGYARNMGVTRGAETPIPNLMAGQSAAWMLCVEGRYLESRGMYEDALDNYLTVLRMGRDYGSPGSMEIHGFISIAIQEVALESIYRLVTTDNLDRPALDSLAERLREIEETQNPVADWFRNEYAAQAWGFEREKQDPERLRWKREAFAELSEEHGELVDDAVQQSDRVTRDLQRVWDFLIASAGATYWELDSETHQRKRAVLIESVHPLLEKLSHHEEVDVCHRVMMAKLHLTRIVTALAAYKLDHERPPEQLSGLVPEYLESVPIDPFGGREFSRLYSVGPDRKDDGGKVEYEALNGTFSRGDVVLQ